MIMRLSGKIKLLMLAAVMCGTTALTASDIKNGLTGKFRRLAGDIEDLDRKMRNTDPESKKGINQLYERCKLSLEFIHEGQKFLLNSRKNDRQIQKAMLIMKNESAFLQETLKNEKSFPGLAQINDVKTLLKAARSGKFSLERKIPKSDNALLQEIQKEQRKALHEIFKKKIDAL